MSYIYTIVVESQNLSSISASFLIWNAKKAFLWRIGGALVAQGGPGTFNRCLRIMVIKPRFYI